MIKIIGKTLLLIAGLFLLVCIILFFFGDLNMMTAKVVGSILGLYTTPILFGNLLFLDYVKNNDTSLIKRIFGATILSVAILFVMNFILWVIVWGAPFMDLFTERNQVFYLIGFVFSLLFVTILHLGNKVSQNKSSLK